MSTRLGIMRNTIEDNVEYGNLIQSYNTPLAVYIPQSNQNILFYSDDCRAEGQDRVSNTTRKHLRKYKEFYLSENAAVGVEVPHASILLLHMILRNPEHSVKYVESVIKELYILYIEN